MSLSIRLEVIGIITLALLCNSGCEDNANQAPVILSVTADPTITGIGELVQLACRATDIDQDELDYVWSSEFGSFPQGVLGDSVCWQAPDTMGSFSISTTVSDGTDSDKGTVTVVVENQYPVASFVVSPVIGDQDTIFGVDASGSSDLETPEGQLVVRWDWENDGTYDTDWSTTKTATHQYSAGGIYVIKLQVSDQEGLTDSLSHAIFLSPNTEFSEMVLVPAGSFIMGSNSNSPDEQPAHEVILTQDFLLKKYEVTNQEYMETVQWAYDEGLVTASSSTVEAYGVELLDLHSEYCEITFSDGVFAIRESWSSYAETSYPNGYDPSDHPVKEVTWYGAACYCDWVSMIENINPYYHGVWDQTNEHNPYISHAYRLPTEAEWEYAAKFDDNRTYPWGETDPNCDYANFFNEDFCTGWTVSIGTYQLGASQLGLVDMAGNLWEWTGDSYDSNFYASSPGVDPIGGTSDHYYKVRRGGYWYADGRTLTCAYRSRNNKLHSDYSTGFRVARTANP